MIAAALILILSTAMIFFYFQTTCQRILRRQLDREYFQSIAKVIRLEFPALRKSLDEAAAPVDYSRLRKALRSDFHALTYLLNNVAHLKGHYPTDERLLTLYFRWQLLSLALRCQLKAGEKEAILRLTSVLEYFAGVVGQHMNPVGCADLTAADYVPDL